MSLDPFPGYMGKSGAYRWGCDGDEEGSRFFKHLKMFARSSGVKN
jgi:hypothetical protein